MDAKLENVWPAASRNGDIFLADGPRQDQISMSLLFQRIAKREYCKPVV
jgi:hypothetical protein